LGAPGLSEGAWGLRMRMSSEDHRDENSLGQSLPANGIAPYCVAAVADVMHVIYLQTSRGKLTLNEPRPEAKIWF